MIKKYLFLTESFISISYRSFNTSNNLFKWFYAKKRTKAPPTKPIKFNEDWEHKIGFDFDLNKPIRGVTDIEEYHLLPDYLKKAYSYKFIEHKLCLRQKVNEVSEKLQIDPLLHRIAYRVVKNSLRIQYQKSVVAKDNKALMFARNVKRMIYFRKLDLKQLLMENKPLMNAICQEFNIHYVDEQPRYYVEPDEKIAPIKAELIAARFKKVKIFKEELKTEEKTFYQMKKQQLQEITAELKSINLTIEEVYKEAINERQEKVLEPINKELYGWFEEEKELKAQFEKICADKKELRERQQRR